MDLEIGPKTKVDDLLTHYPYLLDVLVAQSPLFENLRNPVMRKKMGEVGRERIREHFNLRTQSKRLEEIYSETISRFER